MRILKQKLGLICVGLEGEHLELAEKFHAEAKQMLKEMGIDIVNNDDTYTLSAAEVIDQSRFCRENGAAAIIYMTGTWLLANHIVDAVQEIQGLPIGVWGIPEEISFSSVGMNVVHGTLDEMGIGHRLFYGMPMDKTTGEEIRAFVRACAVKRMLRGTRLGLLGGRAISAYPTTADITQVKAIFGIEIENIDQLVLLEKAKAIPPEVSMQLIERVRGMYGTVDADEEMLVRSVNIYAAMKQIIDEYGLDMLSVKCIGEFMDSYGCCCLALAMLGDEGIVSGCQCNVNAMISSYICAALTGQPSFSGDINVVHEKDGRARLINCGYVPTKLAPSYADVCVKTQYEYMGRGQGACIMFCCKPGAVTFGTLGRVEGKYIMSIAPGTAYTEPNEELERVRVWAQGFVKLNCNSKKFVRNIRSNHSVMCYGDVKKELYEFCSLCGIEALDND